MTLDFDFFKILGDYIRMYKAFPLPVLLCDDGFVSVWSNAAAKSLYPHVAEGDSFRRLLGELDLSHLFARVAADGNCVLEDIIPFTGVQISLSPIVHGDSIVGVTAIFITAQSALSPAQIAEQGFTVPALETHLRQSVADIFSAMDVAALRADLVGAGWIKQHLNRIAGSSYHILRTASNISAFSRHQNHAPVLQLAALDLFDLLAGLSDAISSVSETAGVTVRLLHPDVPAVVAADTDAFQLAFFNVLHNALYFSRRGGTVVVSGGFEDNNIDLTVSDSGAGIPEALLPQIFRPYFSRGHDGKHAGLGLGLPVARTIVEAHGGKISIRSCPGEGTEATIRLPKISPTQALPLAQGTRREAADRFSAVYIGLADARESPYLCELPE